MTTLPNIPDAAVEALARRNYEAEWGDGWDGVLPSIKRGWLNEARAQCEAAAPHLMAEAWDEGWEHARANYSALYTRREIPNWVTLRNPYYRSAGAGE